MALSSQVSADHFDMLPDALVLHILNKLSDVKALGQCSVISKRFHSLASQAEDIVVKVDCVVSAQGTQLSMKPKKKGALSAHILRLLIGGVVKTAQHLLHMVTCYHRSHGPACCHTRIFGGRTSLNRRNASQHSPGEVLKQFVRVKHLHIELPRGELVGIGKDVLFKWRAEFGSTLEACVILAAASLQKAEEKASCSMEAPQQVASRTDGFEGLESNNLGGFTGFPESFCTDGGLKLRVGWVISGLLAASARHYLLQEIVNEHPTLETLVLADVDGQGTLCMHKEQLRAFREKPISVCASSKRTQVPDLNMKLWYAPSMDLTSGAAMQGATLVAIQPCGQVRSKDMDGFHFSALEEPYQRAASSLVRRQSYRFEMNSF